MHINATGMLDTDPDLCFKAPDREKLPGCRSIRKIWIRMTLWHGRRRRKLPGPDPAQPTKPSFRSVLRTQLRIRIRPDEEKK